MDRLAAFSLLAVLILAGAANADDPSETLFETKIRPVLATDCMPCHGGKKTESGLKVDSRESLLRGGDRGPAIVAGEPENSLLVRAIGYTDLELKMPPSATCPRRWRAHSPSGSPTGPCGRIRKSNSRRGRVPAQLATGHFSESRPMRLQPTRLASPAGRWIGSSRPSECCWAARSVWRTGEP